MANPRSEKSLSVIVSHKTQSQALKLKQALHAAELTNEATVYCLSFWYGYPSQPEGFTTRS